MTDSQTDRSPRVPPSEHPSWVIENCAIATMDDDVEYTSGHLVVGGNRLLAVGPGPAPERYRSAAARVLDATGQLATPGLVNTHHHFYQWLTRGLAQDSHLFDWLVELYPTWARIDAPMLGAAARASLAMMARGGVTTAFDHHYVFPAGAGDLLGAEIEAARELGVRLTAARGSMDLGASDGGLPPDFAVESTEAALRATEEAVAAHHDPAPDAMLRIAVAPCSPFSVTTELMRESAALARRLGVRLHTHGSETAEESAFCRERFGMGPTEYFEETGWLGEDVWMAHCVHMTDADIAAFARTGTGVAHCPSSNARLAAGIARVPELLAAGVPVGLGVDGTASNEAGELRTELRNALLVQRLGPSRERALSARQALRLGTLGGAEVLGRREELGSLEAGKLADVVLWRLDGLGHSTIEDPVAALVLGPPAPVALSLVNGVPVVEDDTLLTADEAAVAAEARAQARRLAARAAG
ncbi:Cytosine/adenosine deaminase [Streptomyces zhaozhouensis]|uniref:Cytosine/adenosine deaminase n=1 Tax=Streptomyces zhaozhouensis TaxID=1300267 RepID=A0A286DZ31_9ACTN|nr:8-oxoguanine deaminase [Streptomyces zhaozhouensis]SOD63929.1 Cytosine/adenosine deaminase [Streptomyces zhaozhouensis]